MRTGKKWKIENGRISFSFGYIVCYAVFNLFQQLSISTLFFLNVQLKKTRQIFASQQIFDELARRYHK